MADSHSGELVAQSQSRQGEFAAVYIHEDLMMLMVKERMEDAERYAEQRRALRLTRGARLPLRVRLGVALVRCGHWIVGHPYPGAGRTWRDYHETVREQSVLASGETQPCGPYDL